LREKPEKKTRVRPRDKQQRKATCNKSASRKQNIARGRAGTKGRQGEEGKKRREQGDTLGRLSRGGRIRREQKNSTFVNGNNGKHQRHTFIKVESKLEKTHRPSRSQARSRTKRRARRVEEKRGMQKKL